MTDFASMLIADQRQKARLIHLVDKQSFDAWLKRQTAEDRALIAAHRFDGSAPSKFVLLPRGGDFDVVTAVKDIRALSTWCLAKLAEALPSGLYKLAEGAPGKAALGWLLAQHRFDAYCSKKDEGNEGPRVLLSNEAAQIDQVVSLAEATALVRDLVNTPSCDLGPAELEEKVLAEGNRLGAKTRVTAGDELVRDYPLIAAVGGAASSARAPRLIELEWGQADAPRIAIVGKGVCFDSGGLDLKPATGMRLMKKDMGGAAHALALTRLVIEARLPVHVQLLIPAVENAVSATSYRPGDIIKSRKGMFVEIDNTDAEGRLILADALTRAVEQKAELIVDFATLTGAARVALGPDLPAFFTNDDHLAASCEQSSVSVDDPLWRMPLWQPYEEILKSDVADFANAANSPMAGCITAALFLKKFVPDQIPWAHLDTYSWRDQGRPGRPKGGEALGLRAIFDLLQQRYLHS